MDVLYPLKDKKSVWGDLELHYSIQSLRKFTNADNIYIIGKKREIKHPIEGTWIDFPDQYDTSKEYQHRHENVRQKILRACDSDISDPFLLMNDDFFILRPLELDMPLYYNGTCKEFAKGKGGEYKKQLEKIEGKWFELHVPMVIDKDVFREATKPFMLYRSLYGNASDRPKQQMRDVKWYGDRSFSQMAQLSFISVSDMRFPRALRGLVESRINS